MLNKATQTNDGSPHLAAHSQTYQSYLVRIWRPGDGVPWQASITQVATGESYTFTTVQTMFVYLHKRLNQQVPPSQ